MTRKVLALLLSVLMVITMIPFTVFAEDAGETVEPVAPIEVKFVYGDKSFTQQVTVGGKVTIPELPADAVVPAGKILAGWLAGGVRYYVGTTHTFTEGGITEYTAEFVDRGSVVLGAPKAQYPTGTSAISNFEAPWSSTGNYAIQGIEYAVTTFDGQAVKSFKKADSAEKIRAIRAADNAEKTDYVLNLFSYNQFKDSKNTAVTARDASYVVVEYYYDTTARDTSDPYGAEIAGNTMNFATYNVFVNGTQTSVSLGAAARTPIVANKWDKAVMPLIEKESTVAYFAPETESQYQVGQWVLHPFGQIKGQQMYKGDVFYIKSIEYYDYDPDAAAPRAAEVYLAEGAEAFHVYNNVKDLDIITLPTVITPDSSVEKVEGGLYVDYSADEDFISGKKRFNGWVRKNYGTTYESGASFKLNDLDDAIFYAEIAEKFDITFAENGDASTVQAYKGDSIVIPELSADAVIPEGKMFAGWVIGGKTYVPGDTYVFDGVNTEATAYFDTSIKVYYSADGAIDGVATVYNSLSAADVAIAKLGGVGSIIVEGDLVLNNATHNFTAKDITIKGYNASQTATFNASATVGLQSAVNTKITFDDITIVRGDGSNDENFLSVVGATLVFGKNCTFVQGTRTTNGAKLNLYFGQNGNKTAGYTLEMNSPAVILQQLAPHGGWSNGNYTLNGDYKIIVNAGTIVGGFFVSRNGNSNGKPSTVNGNVTYEINGGTVSSFFVGSHKNDKLNGTATLIINGGNISGLKYGNDGSYTDNTAGTYDNIAVIYNVKSILDGGYTVPAITKTNNQNIVKNSVVVVNNAELIATAPSLDVVDYNVQVLGGKATPVFTDAGVSFEIESDDTAKTAVYANGKAIEAVDGLYTLPAGVVTVQFAAPGSILNTVTYIDDDETLDAGFFAAGDTFYIVAKGLKKDGFSLEGYKVGETNYYIGDVFTMPEEAVTFEALWVENPKNAYYVSSAIGNDDYSGLTATRPFASINKAYDVIGTKDAVIVIIGEYTIGYIGNTDSNKNFKFAVGQHVAITGKDPYTGEDYAAKVTRPNSHRPQINQGHVELSYIIENHVANTANHPFNVNGSSEFTLGTGYQFHSNNGANKPGTQVNTVGGTSPTLNIDGATQFVTFVDWGTKTMTGDLTINIGPNATFSNYGVVLGGDGGTVTATIQGKVYVNVNGNKSGKPVGLSGFKSTVSTVLNGVQIILNETNMYVTPKVTAAGSYVNNGATYIVTTPVIPEGANVETTTFGKVLVTIPEGLYAIVSSTKTVDGVAVPVEEELSETTEITLNEGDTTINFTNTLNRVTVKYEDGTEEEYYGSTIYTLPEGADVDDKKFYGWVVDGVFMDAGTTFTLPEEDGTVVNVVAQYYNNEDTIYLSTLAGDDSADGFTAETALKTLEEVKERLALFNTTAAKLVIVDEYYAKSFTMPSYAGVLTVEGGKLGSKEGINLASDTIFKNIALYTTDPYKHIVFNGHDVTFDEGVTKAEGSEGILIHAGRINTDMTGDQKIVLNSGVVDNLMYGPFYVTTGTTKTWTGNLEIVIDGAQVTAIVGGDGYTGVGGNFVMTGNQLITVKSGSLNTYGANYMTAIEGNATIIDYTDFDTYLINHKENPVDIYLFNMREGNVVTSCENGVLTIEEEANLVGGDNIVTGTTFKVTEPGVYDVMNTPIVTSEGAQIRLYVDENTPSALRFVAKAYGVTMDAKADYGMLVYPTELLGEEELTHALVGEKMAKEVMAEKIFAHDGTSFTYTAAVVGIADTAEGYQKKFTVVPFYKDANGDYVYLEAMNYSLYDIASVAEGEDAESDYIKGIIETVNPSDDTPDENEAPEAPIE